MKTFKLVGLKTVRKNNENSLEELPLADGLVINKEDGENSWMVEALLSKNYRYFFEKAQQTGEEIRIYVTITKKSNKPAQIMAKVQKITTLSEHVSVLLEGRMLTGRNEIDSEKLLSDLIVKGYAGDQLLTAFKKEFNNRKKLLTVENKD
ncbi:YwpF-like family protein [Bacillus carboniphilus]|uniref:YwpF-like family protein n=1 Tax=Bacillus carboniphilus TaxID=86663 RepID=A0ABY9JT53_9BACI|nr:YwpF-like family protein [Bacillus carboniphilus]WLR41610.1 YwpF-like family protein [Bacillus carboniphilus]